MNPPKDFNKYENAHAILNGMEDCSDEFVENFIQAHKKPIDNQYMYDWLIRSLLDVVKINHSILYVACGTSGYTRLFRNMKKFVGIDFSKKMIAASKKLHKSEAIDFEFHCTTFEQFQTNELFDVIYLGPYGHYVPYTPEVLEKAKNLLCSDGVIFCTCVDPEFKGFMGRIKAMVKHFINHKNLDYDPVQKLEKMIEKTRLGIILKLRMKTTIGYGYCYIIK
jgi:SAM-dependent methyltransferase